MNIQTIQDEIQTNGFAVSEGVLPPQTGVELVQALRRLDQGQSAHRRGGMRNLLEASPAVREFTGCSAIRVLIEAVLGPDAFPVRGILFDKIPEANWKVPWHQDVTIAVQKRIDADGFGPWTMNADVLHVQPPAAILENMVSIRLHLDDCGEENGALRVIPGSHRRGRIPEEEIASIRDSSREHVCSVGRGGSAAHAASPAACIIAVACAGASAGDSFGFLLDSAAVRFKVVLFVNARSASAWDGQSRFCLDRESC